jgi:hypothetical protein
MTPLSGVAFAWARLGWRADGERPSPGRSGRSSSVVYRYPRVSNDAFGALGLVGQSDWPGRVERGPAALGGGRTDAQLRLPTPPATLRIMPNSFPPFGSLLLQSEACRLVQSRYRARRRPMSRLRGSLGTCAFGGKLPETSGPGRLAPCPSASACLTWFELPEARALLQAHRPRTLVCDDPSREIRSSALPTPALPFFPLLFALPADLNPLCPARTEFFQICRAVAVGFALMGFIGYFVKLIHIPMCVSLASAVCRGYRLCRGLSRPCPTGLERCVTTRRLGWPR